MSVLTKKAVLAALNVGGWEPRKKDDDAANIVHKHFHAEKDSGNYNKVLIDVKDESWVRITKARSALRDYHYTHTVGWIHKGAQLLPAAMYLDYNGDIIKLIREYTNAAEAFIAHSYDDLKKDAKIKRNGLYRESDYPSKAELVRKFYAEVKYLPVPDAGHVVVDLVNDEVKRIQRDTESMIEAAVEQSRREVWERLYEPVRNMAAALVEPDKRFHDTLVSNVRDMVKMAPSMNLADDKKLDAMVEEVKKNLTKASADSLRNNPDKRAEQAKKAADLAKKMASLMPKP